MDFGVESEDTCRSLLVKIDLVRLLSTEDRKDFMLL